MNIAEMALAIRKTAITIIISISEKPCVLRETMSPFFLTGSMSEASLDAKAPVASVLTAISGLSLASFSVCGVEGLRLQSRRRRLANPHVRSSYGQGERASKY